LAPLSSLTDIAAGQLLTRSEHSLLTHARHPVWAKCYGGVVPFIDLPTSGVTPHFTRQKDGHTRQLSGNIRACNRLPVSCGGIHRRDIRRMTSIHRLLILHSTAPLITGSNDCEVSAATQLTGDGGRPESSAVYGPRRHTMIPVLFSIKALKDRRESSRCRRLSWRTAPPGALVNFPTTSADGPCLRRRHTGTVEIDEPRDALVPV
jgi:hypothetical protein